MGLWGPGGRVPRLPFTRREAAAIADAERGQRVRTALGFQANRAAALSPELGRYSIVHFATHGFVNTKQPELSGVILSLVDTQGRPVDGFLRLHDIYNMNLNAELVVLSACRTALGKDVRGEGLVGLTRGFMYAGSPRVVASLWRVDDAATAVLMKSFYRAMLGNEALPAAAALRSAQIDLWKSRAWKDAFYWAGFVIHGEWAVTGLEG